MICPEVGCSQYESLCQAPGQVTTGSAQTWTAAVELCIRFALSLVFDVDIFWRRRVDSTGSLGVAWVCCSYFLSPT